MKHDDGYECTIRRWNKADISLIFSRMYGSSIVIVKNR